MTYTINDMATIKALFYFLDWIALTFLGIAIIDMINLFQNNILDFSNVEGTPFQYVYILVGIGYFILNGYNNYQSKKIERETKKLENKKLEEEIESIEIDNEKKNVTK